MYLFYQTAENGQQKWQPVLDKQADKVRRDVAYHMSIYKLDKLPEGVDPTTIKYKGDLWFDIDHKPAVVNPNEDDYKEAVHESITDVRRLLSYFESIDLDPKYCRIFASGSKGFHVCVPAELMGATAAVKYLPRIHKHIAQVIQERSGATGIDLQIYSMGKGHMMRVENKPRPNGRFKVPVSYEEIKLLTPAQYVTLTSSTRVEVIHVPPATMCRELAFLYAEAQAELDTYSRLNYEAVPNAQLGVFSDGNHPVCITQLVQGLNIKPGENRFNRAKMSMARYLMSAPITDSERNVLVDEFSNNWHSDRNPTVESKRKAVQEALKFGQENGFSCSLMIGMLQENPCRGCKLKVQQQREIATRSLVEVTDFGYQRVAARGAGPMISNFIMRIESQHIENDGSVNTFLSFSVDILQTVDEMEPRLLGNLTLNSSAWLSSYEFKRQLACMAGISWVGNEVDLQHLKALLTNRMALKDIKTMKYVRSVGIHHHVDEERDIDEWVWVEEKYSRSSTKAKNTLVFAGPSGTSEGNHDALTVRLENVKPYDPYNSEQNATIMAMLRMNLPEVLAPTLGWVYSCWLRVHLRSQTTTEKHLPSLQIFGSSGHGKTETATLLATLAGANYFQNEPLVVSASSPYTIKVEASISTTVPRIFDEMNEHKIGERNKYSAAREAVKAAARAGSQRQGYISDQGTQIDNRPATSPIIMLATQVSPEREINQRTVPVSINKQKRLPAHSQNFTHARKNLDHLISLCRTNMVATLELPMEWVYEAIDRNRPLVPSTIHDSRIASNYETVLIGLDFMYYIMDKVNAPDYILAEIKGLKDFFVGWLQDNEQFISQQTEAQEIDSVIDTFGEMIIQNLNDPLFRHGTHYHIIGDTLQIWVTAFFPQYIKYMRQTLMRPPELASRAQFDDLIRHQPYFIEADATPGWVSLHIPNLIERHVRIENFRTF